MAGGGKELLSLDLAQVGTFDTSDRNTESGECKTDDSFLCV